MYHKRLQFLAVQFMRILYMGIRGLMLVWKGSSGQQKWPKLMSLLIQCRRF